MPGEGGCLFLRLKELVHAVADLIQVLIYQIRVLLYVWRTGSGIDLLLVGNDVSKYRPVGPTSAAC